MKNTTHGTTPPAKDPRTPAGSNYGDVVPDSPRYDPSKGAELERDAMPPDADFTEPPPGSAGAAAATPDKPRPPRQGLPTALPTPDAPASKR